MGSESDMGKVGVKAKTKVEIEAEAGAEVIQRRSKGGPKEDVQVQLC